MDRSREMLDQLTRKQRECLDLVLQRYTSKEIALKLGITNFAVDERLRTARRVMGVTTREEAVRRYSELLKHHEPITYSSIGVPPHGGVASSPGQETEQLELRDIGLSYEAFVNSQSATPRPRTLIGRLGKFGRLAAIMALAILIMLTGVSALALMQAITSVARA